MADQSREATYMAGAIKVEAVANEALGYLCVEGVNPTHGDWLERNASREDNAESNR